MRLLYLFTSFLLISHISQSQIIKVNTHENVAYFSEGNDSILVYQIAKKSINGKYKRNNYIHPLYDLDGEVITQDFPKDHLHHRGIFWAWHQLYIEKKRLGNGWELAHFNQEIVAVQKLKPTGVSKSIKTNVLWKSDLLLDNDGNQKPLINEKTTITVYPKKKNYRLIAIKIVLTALQPNISIGGSTDDKGYGGFSARVKLSEDITFTGPSGKVTPNTLPVKAGKWLDISNTKGISIFSHPKNPGFPNPWILRSQKSMQNTVFPHPGKKTIPLPHNKPITLRYGLLIHNGTANDVNIERLYQKYTIIK